MQLRTLLTLIVGIITTLALAVLSGLFFTSLNTYRSETGEQAVRTRAQALGAFLSRSLYEEWRQIEHTAATFQDLDDQDALQDRIDAMGASDEKVSWIGVAANDGTVLASTRGRLTGESVAQRPWFQRGLAGPFAGDVHEAVLLARLMQSDTSESLRFVDLSAPILDEEGNVLAVLGAHVNWSWVRSLVAEAAQMLELDVLLVNRDGTIILSTTSIQEATARLNSVQAARRGVAAMYHEVWPDGVSYQVFTVPDLAYGTLPTFGWSLVARLDPAVLDGPQQRFQAGFGFAALLGLLFVLIAFALVAGIIIRPLRRISQALLDQIMGVPVSYIREHRRFAEVQTLSEVLARLQAKDRRIGDQRR